jgi:hypothetical protein
MVRADRSPPLLAHPTVFNLLNQSIRGFLLSIHFSFSPNPSLRFQSANPSVVWRGELKLHLVVAIDHCGAPDRGDHGEDKPKKTSVTSFFIRASVANSHDLNSPIGTQTDEIRAPEVEKVTTIPKISSARSRFCSSSCLRDVTW